jgi:hypothetical protein
VRPMAQANHVHNTANPQDETCPVIPIALRVGQLWDACTAAQERDAADNDTISDQIDDLRIATAETASFVRARSIAGALFQVAIASETAERLYRQLPEEKQLLNRTYLKLNRLLRLAAATLCDELETEDYAPIRGIVEAYIGDLGPAMLWVDEIAATEADHD